MGQLDHQADFFRIELVAQALGFPMGNAAAEPTLPDGQGKDIGKNQGDDCYT